MSVMKAIWFSRLNAKLFVSPLPLVLGLPRIWGVILIVQALIRVIQEHFFVTKTEHKR